MSFFEVCAAALVIILGLMALLWLVSLPLKKSSIVDIFWAPALSVWPGFISSWFPRKKGP